MTVKISMFYHVATRIGMCNHVPQRFYEYVPITYISRQAPHFLNSGS